MENKNDPKLSGETISKVKVSNMSGRSGGEVVNQFEISTPEGVYFQSYRSIIAFVPSQHHKVKNGIDYKIMLDASKWDYSRTTGKYRNQFLGETKPETLKKIKSGEYILADLN